MTLLFAIALLGGTPLPPFPGPQEPETTIPTIRARDLRGDRHVVPDPAGLDPTLLVVATGRHETRDILAWLEDAGRFLPPGARVELVLATTPDQARAAIPEMYWDRTLADPEGRIARELGLAESRWPQVLALDEVGRVLVGYRGRADDPAARRVWNALRPYPRPPWPLW
jgi:hypothetical protein